jgi:hypothetical protein
MISFLRWKRKLAALPVRKQQQKNTRRNCQLNVKVTKECSALFAAMADAYGMTKADLFGAMVEERQQQLERDGLKQPDLSR